MLRFEIMKTDRRGFQEHRLINVSGINTISVLLLLLVLVLLEIMKTGCNSDKQLWQGPPLRGARPRTSGPEEHLYNVISCSAI